MNYNYSLNLFPAQNKTKALQEACIRSNTDLGCLMPWNIFEFDYN